MLLTRSRVPTMIVSTRCEAAADHQGLLKAGAGQSFRKIEWRRRPDPAMRRRLPSVTAERQ